MIQSIAEYQKLAARTCPDLGTFDANALHMDLGVFTELGELLDGIKRHHAYGKAIDIVNIGEEIADTMWYIVNLCTLLKHELINEYNYTPVNSIPEVVGVVRALYSYQIYDATCEFGKKIRLLQSIAVYFELDFFQLLTNNIDKLKVRYPEKFDNEKALNRNLDAERKELEK